VRRAERDARREPRLADVALDVAEPRPRPRQRGERTNENLCGEEVVGEVPPAGDEKRRSAPSAT
jgi:hypothetical protein